MLTFAQDSFHGQFLQPVSWVSGDIVWMTFLGPWRHGSQLQTCVGEEPWVGTGHQDMQYEKVATEWIG